MKEYDIENTLYFNDISIQSGQMIFKRILRIVRQYNKPIGSLTTLFIV